MKKNSFREASYKGWVYAKLNGAAPMIRPDPPPSCLIFRNRLNLGPDQVMSAAHLNWNLIQS